MLHARGQSTATARRQTATPYTQHSSLQQQHVDRLHRHTIHTTQQFTTAARRQTAPPHHTHDFCWHGPRQRSHGKGDRYFYQLVVETGATSGELWRCRYNPKGDGCYLSTDRLRVCNMYQFYCCCCLSFSTSLSLCLCSRVPHTTISFLYLPFYFFAATTKCLYKRHLFPTTQHR